jgi:hypothetical protein
MGAKTAKLIEVIDLSWSDSSQEARQLAGSQTAGRIRGRIRSRINQVIWPDSRQAVG